MTYPILLGLLFSSFIAEAFGQTVAPSAPAATGSYFDLATLTGVLGVILTIAFFVFGYRQTIGARKERTDAANRDIADTLLRRFTLESDFAIQFADIDRFIAGKALDYRIKYTDAWSREELWTLLYARVISSDYVSPKQRKGILQKLNSCFEADNLAAGDIQDSTAGNGLQKNERKLLFLILLGALSALAASAFSAGFAKLVVGEWQNDLGPTVLLPLLVATILSAAVATAMVFLTQLRDRASTSGPEPSDLTQTQRSASSSFEAEFIRRLDAADLKYEAKHRDIDFVVEKNNLRIAVELKSVITLSRSVKLVVDHTRKAAAKYNCEEARIVIASTIPDHVKKLGDDKIKIVTVDEFFAEMEDTPQLALAR